MDAKTSLELVLAIVLLLSALVTLLSNKSLKESISAALLSHKETFERFREDTKTELESLKADLKDFSKNYMLKEDHNMWMLTLAGITKSSDNKSQAIHDRLDKIMNTSRFAPRGSND